MSRQKGMGCTMEIEIRALGSSISLSSIYQYRTYLGCLGLPHKRLNDDIINEAVAWARKNCSGDGNPFLIPPERHDPAESGIERLPLITCIAEFESRYPAKDKTKTWSCLNVVWFQDKLCFPIDEAILSKLQRIKWQELASDFDP
jgi:hypothetical protein